MSSPNVDSSDDNSRANSGSSKKPLIIGGIVLVIAVVAAGLFWFLRDDAPDRVNLEDAIEQNRPTDPADGEGDEPDDTAGDETTTSGDEGDDGDEGDGATGGIEGTWSVDTETGEFDYESATGSFVGFRIQEELVGVGATEAVGRTGDVTGSMTIEGTTVTEGSFDVDLTTITTNESRRDDRVQSALNTSTNPTATFTLTAPIELGAAAAGGETVTTTATGDLTINGITNEIAMPIEARLVDGTVFVVGSVQITFADWDVEVPSAPIVVGAEDHGDLELQLLLVRG